MSEQTHRSACELGTCRFIMILTMDVTNPQYALKAHMQENKHVATYKHTTCH